jgi:hypothetical protein
MRNVKTGSLVKWLIATSVFLTATAQTAICTTTFDYRRIVHFIQSQNLEEPLVLFTETHGEFDQRLNRENLRYLNQNPNLLDRIQQRLTAPNLEWKLNTSSKRLMVVPEQREAYAALFERYVYTAVNEVLAVTGLPNPYARITTLTEPVVLAQVSKNKKVTAYLVHNIADEYIEEYLFFNPEKEGTKIKIKLQNRVYTGRIGSYSSRLTIGENNSVEFKRDPYTLWQNCAENPINVLVAPVEETLHIALRGATEKAIQTQIAQSAPESMAAVECIVDEWMAVEEAVVGGVAAKVMPLVLRFFRPEPLENQLSVSFSDREKHAQYRFLQNGIQVVAQMGIQPAIALYTADPDRFKRLVLPTSVAVPPRKSSKAREG